MQGSSQITPIEEETTSTIHKLRVKKTVKTKRIVNKLSKAIESAQLKQLQANEFDSRFFTDLHQRTGINLETTLKNLNSMSRAILETPELMEEAERADRMLLAAIHAKLEIIDLL